MIDYIMEGAVGSCRGLAVKVSLKMLQIGLEIITEKQYHTGAGFPARQRNERHGEIPEWSKGTDCKSVGSAFAGSNPALATILRPGGASYGRPAFADAELWIGKGGKLRSMPFEALCEVGLWN